MTPLHTLRLVSPSFWVDVRLRRFETCWMASADTPDGPSVGLGRYPIEALAGALEPFDGVVDELLGPVPHHLY